MFKDINAEQSAEQKLINLQWWGSAATYAVKFQRITFNINWEDILLMAQYYRELKNSIKDDIIKAEQSEELQIIIALTVQIDN